LPKGSHERETLTRRRILQRRAGAVVAAGAGSLAWVAHARSTASSDLAKVLAQVKSVRDLLVSKLPAMRDPRLLARDDGYIYTIDAAQLMLVFAMAHDAAGYDAMRLHAEKNLIIDDPNLSNAKGFVRWRWKEGQSPDASGTTEALRSARAIGSGRRHSIAPLTPRWRRKFSLAMRTMALSIRACGSSAIYYNFHIARLCQQFVSSRLRRRLCEGSGGRPHDHHWRKW